MEARAAQKQLTCDNAQVGVHNRSRDMLGVGLSKASYISPEGMAAGLSTLTRLRSLHIRFRSPASFPDGICLPPVTRAVLPALTAFEFEGVSNYLEDLVARLDCPRLNKIKIKYLYQRIGFQISQLFEFINRPEDPRLTLFESIDAMFVCTGCVAQFYHEDHFNVAIYTFFVSEEWRVPHVY